MSDTLNRLAEVLEERKQAAPDSSTWPACTTRA
jgi:hypothetical protein